MKIETIIESSFKGVFADIEDVSVFCLVEHEASYNEPLIEFIIDMEVKYNKPVKVYGVDDYIDELEAYPLFKKLFVDTVCLLMDYNYVLNVWDDVDDDCKKELLQEL
ncbi:hypothetical protein D0T50_06240 [Bacteroides sp. 214]|uniref:hypothetical protein n=1 Tax=Bacteroides sp. 214 TaxID=2302935 RepID=UPI0013D42B7B|nr:hypothetical protein [Bacteroides sp. 214]NDW12489.1 hypothetical protein [Bacteroides sp. 214]